MDTNETQIFYDTTASAYATSYIHELDHKPFDRFLLKRFAEENTQKGLMADVGCGPGHITKFLADAGVKEIIGIDLSKQMIAQAAALFPAIQFRTGNMLAFNEADGSFGSVLAFYSMVHFDPIQLGQFFKEAFRVLKPGGQFLISFHIGDHILKVNELLGVKANADFYFFEPGKVSKTLEDSGFKLIDVITRQPYPDKEYPSNRAYIIAEK